MNDNSSTDREITMDSAIKRMTANLRELDKAVKILEKESADCKNACAGLKSTIREIDGAIRG